MWSTPAVWKQYNKMAVLHFLLVNSTLIYIQFSLTVEYSTLFIVNCLLKISLIYMKYIIVPYLSQQYKLNFHAKNIIWLKFTISKSLFKLNYNWRHCSAISLTEIILCVCTKRLCVCNNELVCNGSIPSPLAPDPISVEACVCCLFWTNRNCLSFYLSHYLIRDKSYIGVITIHGNMYTSTETIVTLSFRP